MLTNAFSYETLAVVIVKLQQLASIDVNAAMKLFAQFIVSYSKFINVLLNIIQFGVGYLTGNGLLTPKAY